MEQKQLSKIWTMMNYSRSKIYNIDEDTLVGKRGEKKTYRFYPSSCFPR